MARPQNNPLRPLSEKERADLERRSRSQAAPAGEVSRARALLAVAEGASFTDAARAAGRRSGDGVAHLVARFNRDGMDAIKSKHGGGPAKRYGRAEQERILREVRRSPDRVCAHPWHRSKPPHSRQAGRGSSSAFSGDATTFSGASHSLSGLQSCRALL
jgi:hypothetical protein